jgi:hypothetical protein
MKTYISYTLIILLLFLSSCAKDELTLPSDVLFKFGITPYEASESNEPKGIFSISSGNSFVLNKGIMLISAIEFEGKRDEGQDVYFMSNFSRTVIANLESESTNFDVKFDIPQGVYNRVDVTIHLDNSNNTPLVIEGVMHKNASSSVPLKFEYAFPDQVRIRAHHRSNQNIVLRKDQRSVAKVILDASYLFRFVNPNLLASADVLYENGEPFILINSNNNKPIFNQVASRLGNSFIVVFE